MPCTSIIRSDIPQGPSDEGILRREIQLKRKDPEAKILKELLDAWSGVSPDIWDDLIVECCEKLGGITTEQLIHKIERDGFRESLLILMMNVNGVNVNMEKIKHHNTDPLTQQR